jgi:hypothetical protein
MSIGVEILVWGNVVADFIAFFVRLLKQEYDGEEDLNWRRNARSVWNEMRCTLREHVRREKDT